MIDLEKSLRELGDGMGLEPIASAAQLRRLGQQRRARRHTAAAAGAGLAAVGAAFVIAIGVGGRAEVREPAATPTSRVTPTTRTPSPSPSEPAHRLLSAVTDFPLGVGMSATGNEKLTRPTREGVAIMPEGLPDCINPATAEPERGAIDALGTAFAGYDGAESRFLRVYADDAAASAALARWASTAATCAESEDLDVRSEPDELDVLLSVRNAAPGYYPRSGWFAVRRVGPALLTVILMSDQEGTPAYQAAMEADVRTTLARLVPKMCAFSTDGCD